MMLQEAGAVAGLHHTGPENTPRLRLKPKARSTGYVDGAWWPRSDDLPKELPDLLAVLSVHVGAIDRVTYNINEWTQAPAGLATGRQAIQLDGHHRQLPNTLEILGANRDKIVLLVVPPHTDPDYAHAVVIAAAASDNVSSVDTLLMIGVKDRESRTKRAAAQERWESQGRAEQSTGRDRRRPMRHVFPASSRYGGAPPPDHTLGTNDYDK